MTKAKSILAWHWLPQNGKLTHDLNNSTMIVGETRSLPASQRVVLCTSGFHASYKALDALYYARGPLLCRVQLWGNIKSDGYYSGYPKLVARHRRVLWAIDASYTLHQLSIKLLKDLNNQAPNSIIADKIAKKQAWLSGKLPKYAVRLNWDSGLEDHLLSKKTSDFYLYINNHITEQEFLDQLRKDMQLPTVLS